MKNVKFQIFMVFPSANALFSVGKRRGDLGLVCVVLVNEVLNLDQIAQGKVTCYNLF